MKEKKSDKQRNFSIKFFSSIAILYTICILCMTGCRRAQPLRQDLPANERESYRIGLNLPTTQLFYRKAMKELVEAAYPGTQDDGGIEILIYDAGGSQKQQNQDILEMTDLGVDGIVLIPGTMEGCLSSVEYANTKGVPVITVDNRIRSSTSARAVSFVGADHYSMGKDAATLFLRLLEEQYPEKEIWNVIQLTGIPDTSGAIDRGQAIADTLSGNSRIRLLGSYDGEFTVINAKSVMEDCLVIFDEIDGVICQNDNMAEGCYLALKEADKDGSVIVVGIDGQKSTLEIMADGGIHGTVLQHPSMILDGIHHLCRYLDGNTLDENYIEPTDIIDKTNVKDYLEHDLTW